MPVKQRLIEYIKLKGISTREFCRSIGVSETYINNMRSSVQPDKLIRITQAFPDLNTEWLLTGNGDMLRKDDNLPPIPKDILQEIGADIFKDKIIEMFKKGEIFSASIVWEQHRMIIDSTNKITALELEVERLKNKLAQYEGENE